MTQVSQHLPSAPDNLFNEPAVPPAEASITDRIRYLIKLMRRTQAQFAEQVGLDPSMISKVLSGKLTPSESLINRIVVNIGVSKAWLTTGEDVPFPRQLHASEMRDTGQRIKDALLNVNPGAPVYDIDVTAGTRELSRMFTDERVVGYLSMPGINPDCPIVRVSGDSMSPRISNGGYISIRPVSNSAPIFWGQIYVVVLEDYRMVKFIRRHPDPSKVILHSENPRYDDMEIPRNSIQQLYLVEKILNYEIVC